MEKLKNTDTKNDAKLLVVNISNLHPVGMHDTSVSVSVLFNFVLLRSLKHKKCCAEYLC